ncbi:N-acetyl-gamma-glutamyl-phosphate reductase [Candidatus Acetothermia bacterium]|nr:N-acetyl-gamma-glutamyl-phosphate reductase [Candidatus Acetothermia bacterium]
MSDKIRVAIIGGSGYVGGELLRLLLRHPNVDIAAITSRSQAGKPVTRAHPNLRGVTALKFSAPDELQTYDTLFLALPHGSSMEQMRELTKVADRVIDLGADFRLKNSEDYSTWYGYEHKCPEFLKDFVYGIPELHREEIQKTRWVAVPGCTSTSAIIPLWPLVKKYRVKLIVVDSKVGSSAGGLEPGPDSHHPERAGVVRSFKPSGHRHLAEMEQELGLAKQISFSPHAVELIRGILSTIHVFMEDAFTEKDIWQTYLQTYGEEPFVRIVKERTGIYRFPEPKLVAGTNYCDIGFEKDERTGRLVVMSAIDNLVKGAAGQAVQCLNLMYGVDESAGLDCVGLHP